MTIQTPVFVSTQPDDGKGDKLRDAFIKINERFQDIAALFQNKGDWATGTEYEPRDYIIEGGEAYVCTIAHTGGVFADDLASGKWASVDALDLRADLASDAEGKGSALVAFKQAGTGAVATDVQSKLRESVSVKDFGAVGDGVTDDASAEIAAHGASTAVVYPAGTYFGVDAPLNLYSNNNYRNALHHRVQSGISSNPVSDASPVIWAQKFSNSNRSLNPQEWDQGGGYFGLIKTGGDSYGAGLTGYVRHLAGDGQMIGVHGRGFAAHADAQVWGGWSYIHNTTEGHHTMIGHEINISNRGPDLGWLSTPDVVGASRGLVITPADNGTAGTQMGIYLGKHATSAGWYTGFLNLTNSIIPTGEEVEIGNGEVLRLQGGSNPTNKYGGIRFEKGQFQYGTSTAEASFLNNCAHLLGKNQRIVFGTRPTNGSYITWTDANMFNVQGGVGVSINGTQIVTTRRTGWEAATGTAAKSTFDTSTVTTAQLAARVKALIDDLTTHGLIGS